MSTDKVDQAEQALKAALRAGNPEGIAQAETALDAAKRAAGLSATRARLQREVTLENDAAARERRAKLVDDALTEWLEVNAPVIEFKYNGTITTIRLVGGRDPVRRPTISHGVVLALRTVEEHLLDDLAAVREAALHGGEPQVGNPDHLIASLREELRAAMRAGAVVVTRSP